MHLNKQLDVFIAALQARKSCQRGEDKIEKNITGRRYFISSLSWNFMNKVTILWKVIWKFSTVLRKSFFYMSTLFAKFWL